MELLKKNRLCFNCPKGGHQRMNCLFKCFKCRGEGSLREISIHRFSLCYLSKKLIYCRHKYYMMILYKKNL